MTPDKIALLIFLVFCILCFTHYLALRTGFNMAAKGEATPIIPGSVKASKKKPTKYVDPFEQQYLDYG